MLDFVTTINWKRFWKCDCKYESEIVTLLCISSLFFDELILLGKFYLGFARAGKIPHQVKLNSIIIYNYQKNYLLNIIIIVTKIQIELHID